MDNHQTTETKTPQTKRRRNRSNRKTQTLQSNQGESNTATPPTVIAKNVPSDELTKIPVLPTQNVVAPPKRHRVRHRIRNKTQTVITTEGAQQPPVTNPIDLVASQIIQSTPPVIDPQPVISSAKPIMKSNASAESKAPPIIPNKAQVLAEREAKRLAKQEAKHKLVDSGRNIGDSSPEHTAPAATVPVPSSKASGSPKPVIAPANVPSTEKLPEKSREEVIAEREAKKLAKLAGKTKGQPAAAAAAASAAGAAVVEVTAQVAALTVAVDKPVPSKAERRAKQEAQRAAKAVAGKAPFGAKSGVPAVAAKSDSTKAQILPVKKSSPSTASTTKSAATPLHRVKLFNHLYTDREPPANEINSTLIHPSVVKLGAQFANRVVVGSNARCIAFINTIKQVVAEYETPPQKEFSRGLESTLQPYLAYLQQCRPLSVSIINANKFIKWQITQLPADESEAEQKERLVDAIETYIRDQVEKAAQAISSSVQEKISNGDVILTFGCSSLIIHILNDAKSRNVDFRVVVVDARPDHEGQEMLRRLVEQGVKCTCVLVNAVGFIMPEVTKVLLGAHALMANGYVMSRAGTAQVALMAKAHNVPVLVCCETHKFSERVQTDAFVYNEIGNPNDLVLKSKTTRDVSALANWEAIPNLTPLNLRYDITPPELVTAVVTELAILPCTSVPVILRIQPSS